MRTHIHTHAHAWLRSWGREGGKGKDIALTSSEGLREVGQVGWWSRELIAGLGGEAQFSLFEEGNCLFSQEITVLGVLLSTLEMASSFLFWGRCTVQEGGGRH